LLTLALGLGIALRLSHLTDVTSRSPDEKVYTFNAAQLADKGFGVMPALFAQYESNPGNWIYVSPTRFGNVLLFAGAMKLSGARDARAGEAVSCLLSILSLGLLAWIGTRFFNPWIAILAVTLLAASVGELGMARRAWQDITFGFTSQVMVWLTCEITRNPANKWLYPPLFAAGAFALVTKESSVLAYGLCLIWLAGVMWLQERSWEKFGWLLAGWLISLAVGVDVWVLLAGNTKLALSAVNHSVRSGGGAWAQQYCSGPWYQFPYLLWLVGPLTAVMALVGAAASVFQRRFISAGNGVGQILDPRAAGVAALMTLGFVGFASFYPNLQYLRIISPADATYCLLAAIGIWGLLEFARRKTSTPLFRGVLAVAVLAIAAEVVSNYFTFTNVIVRSGMEEMSVWGIRTVMGR